MRHRSSTLAWLGPLVLLVSAGGARRAGAAEPAAPACRNAGVTVSFVRGSMEIDTNGRGALAGVAAWLEHGDQRTVKLDGYADKMGGATGNQRLSEQRAQAAKDYLLARGIAPDRIMVFGHGEALDEPRPAGSDGRIVLVTVCDVPKAAAAETPPPPEPEAAAAPAAAPAPAPAAPPRPPAPVPPAYAPIAESPPPTSASPDRPPSRIGIEATVGAGAIGFIDDTARNATQTGATWDARLLFGSRSLIAVEGAYVGSVQNIEALGLSTSSLLLGNGVEGTLRVNVTRARVQPYLFGGVGWTRYQLTNAQPNTSSLLGSDDVGTVPLGAGLSARLGSAFILDIRGTYRATFGGDMFQGVALNTDSSNAMQTWSASGRVGFEF